MAFNDENNFKAAISPIKVEMKNRMFNVIIPSSQRNGALTTKQTLLFASQRWQTNRFSAPSGVRNGWFRVRLQKSRLKTSRTLGEG